MENKGEFHILSPIPEANRDAAADLFWQGFSGKLGKVLGPTSKALAFLRRVLDPSHGIAAIDNDGTLIGIAGFKTSKGALIGGELSDMRRVYGGFGGLWRGLVLSVLERDLDQDTLLMDGIVVAQAARGRGDGTALLDAVSRKAQQLGKTGVRLDVIDSNPRARALYERRGFVPVGDDHLGPLSWIFGFQKATAMQFDLKTTEPIAE